MVKKLKREGYWVRGVDIKEHEFAETQALWNSSINSARSTKTSYSTGQADEFRLLDLREAHNCWDALNLGEGACPEPAEGFDEVYQLAADMGGMGFIHTAESHCASLIYSLGG